MAAAIGAATAGPTSNPGSSRLDWEPGAIAGFFLALLRQKCRVCKIAWRNRPACATAPRNFAHAVRRATRRCTPFCNGSASVNPLCDVLLAGHSLLYGVGAALKQTRPPPDGVRKGQVVPSYGRVVISHKGVHGLTLSSSLGEGTSLREAGVDTRPKARELSPFQIACIASVKLQEPFFCSTRVDGAERSGSRRHSPFGKLMVERCSIGEHPMHDHRKLACDRHLRLLHAHAFRKLQPPTLER